MKKLVLTQGCLVEPIANYNHDFSGYDEGATKDQIDYQISSGVKGLFANAFTSDAPFLRDDMDVKQTSLLAKISGGRVPIFVQLCENSTSAAIEKAKKYKDAGADVILVTQPDFYDKKDAMRRHFDAIFSACSDITMGFHNSPDIGYFITPEIIAEMANTYDHCVYVKNATQSMAHIQTLHLLVHNPNFRFLEGSDSTILASMAVGGHGVISAIGITVPKLVVALCEACLAGEWKKARDLNDKVSTLRYINKKVKSGDFNKYLATMFGKFNGGYPMPPLLPVNEADGRYLETEYKKLEWLPEFL